LSQQSIKHLRGCFTNNHDCGLIEKSRRLIVST
jgi:hypothetical protein